MVIVFKEKLMQSKRDSFYRASIQNDSESEDDGSEDSFANKRPSNFSSPEGSSFSRGLPELFKQHLHRDIYLLGGIDCITIKHLSRYNSELYGTSCKKDRKKIRDLIYYWKKEGAYDKAFPQSFSNCSPIRLVPSTNLDLRTFAPLIGTPQEVKTMSNLKIDGSLRSLTEAYLNPGYLYEDVGTYVNCVLFE